MANDTLIKKLDATNEIEITVTGRNSGHDISLPIWFTRDGDRLYLVPVNASGSSWYKNVRQNPTIRVRARGSEFAAQATPVTEHDAVEHVVDQFRSKYGADKVEQYYPDHDVAVEVPLT